MGEQASGPAAWRLPRRTRRAAAAHARAAPVWRSRRVRQRDARTRIHMERWHEQGLPRLSARHSREIAMPELEGGPEMTIVAGFDVHRRQITFDALDTDTGELMRGRIDATPSAVERWAGSFEDREVRVALEACTGWLFVSRALAARRCSAPSRRAGRDERAARAQAAREDRSRGRALAAHAARRGTAARILDPAGTRPRVALARAAAQDARRRAHAVAGAHPGDAVSPRHRWRARRAARRRRTRVPAERSSCPPTRASGSRSHWR